MYYKKLKSICIATLLSLALTIPVFAEPIPRGSEAANAQEARLWGKDDHWAVDANYALDKNTGEIYYTQDGENFVTGQIGSDGCYYQADGTQLNSLTYIRDKYLDSYDTLSEEEFMAFDSRQEANLFVCWIQLERATAQGLPYIVNTRSNGVIEIKKSELQRMEAAMEEGGTYQNAVRKIADSIPSDYSIEEIVNYATIQVAKVFMYDSNYEKSSMEEAVREKRGVCYHYARLLKSVLTEVGIESEFIIGYADHSDLSHVWLKIRDEDQNRWIYRDPTRTSFDLQAGLFTVNIYEAYLNSYRMVSLLQDYSNWAS